MQIVSREEDAEFVECLECREIFESSELKDMSIEESTDGEAHAELVSQTEARKRQPVITIVTTCAGFRLVPGELALLVCEPGACIPHVADSCLP